MKTLFIHLKTQKFFCFASLLKAVAFTSVIFLFSNSTQASAILGCRLYFIQTDVLQKLDSVEYASILTSAETLGRLFGKTDPTSVDAKVSLNKQLLDLQRAKKFSAEESQSFLFFLRNKISKAQFSHSRNTQESIKRRLLQTQRDNSIKANLILNKYKTHNLNEAFYLSSHKNGFNNDTIDLQEIQILLDSGADVNFLYHSANTPDGMTALMKAAEQNNLRIMKILIQAQAHLERTNGKGMTALIVASQHTTTVEAVRFLIQQGANIHAADKSLSTPLMYASMAGASKSVDLLLQQKAGLDIQDRNGKTALILAIENGHNKIADKLLDGGAKIDLKTYFDETALHFAAGSGKSQIPNGNDKIVERLISLGADINDTNKDEVPVLILAVRANDESVVRLLLQAKVKLDVTDLTHETPLMIAAKNTTDTIAKLLVQAGANLNHKNGFGETVTIKASQLAKHSLLEMLVREKADIHVRDEDGRTALFQAVLKGDTKSVKILIAAKANINLQDKSLLTPLMYAVLFSKVDIVKILIQEKPNLYLRSSEGHTVLDLKTRPSIEIILKKYRDSLPLYKRIIGKALNLPPKNKKDTK